LPVGGLFPSLLAPGPEGLCFYAGDEFGGDAGRAERLLRSLEIEADLF